MFQNDLTARGYQVAARVEPRGTELAELCLPAVKYLYTALYVFLVINPHQTRGVGWRETRPTRPPGHHGAMIVGRLCTFMYDCVAMVVFKDLDLC